MIIILSFNLDKENNLLILLIVVKVYKNDLSHSPLVEEQAVHNTPLLEQHNPELALCEIDASVKNRLKISLIRSEDNLIVPWTKSPDDSVSHYKAIIKLHFGHIKSWGHVEMGLANR